MTRFLSALNPSMMVSFVSEWTGLESLTKLDTSFSKNSDRLLFHHIISGQNFRHVGTQKPISIEVLEWLILRKIKVRSLCLSELSLGVNHNISVVRKVFELIDKFEFLALNHHKILNDILAFKLVPVEFLTIGCDSRLTDDDLDKFLSLFSGIAKLDLLGCLYLTEKSHDYVAKHCPELKYFRTGQHVDDACGLEFAQGCPNLEDIEIHFVKSEAVTGEILRTHTRLTSLSVSFGGEQSFEMLKVIGQNCPNLTSLEATKNCVISDTAINSLVSGCKQLKRLLLTSIDTMSDITELSLLKIADGLRNLSELNLNQCYKTATDKVVSALMTQCTKLTSLSICMSPITDVGIQAIATHGVNLQTLDVSNCQGFFELSFLDLLDRCKKMRDIDVSKTNISSASVIKLARDMKRLCFYNLRTLRLLLRQISTTTIVRDDKNDSLQLICHQLPTFNVLSLSAMVLQCPLLTELTLNDFSKLTDACLDTVFSHCPLLEMVDILKSCNLLTAATITNMTGKCPLIHSLHISDLVGLSDDVLLLLVENNSDFKSLMLSEVAANITNDFPQELAYRCPDLKVFHLTNNTLLYPNSLTFLLEYCTKLRVLNVSGCTSVDNFLMLAISQHGMCLRELNISDCPIDADDVGKFLFKGHNLKELRYGERGDWLKL